MSLRKQELNTIEKEEKIILDGYVHEIEKEYKMDVPTALISLITAYYLLNIDQMMEIEITDDWERKKALAHRSSNGTNYRFFVILYQKTYPFQFGKGSKNKGVIQMNAKWKSIRRDYRKYQRKMKLMYLKLQARRAAISFRK